MTADPQMAPATDREKHTAAVDAVARQLVAASVRTVLDLSYLDWEDYPDVGEYDWGRVITRARAIVQSIEPGEDGYRAAYEHLAECAREELPSP